MLKKILIVVALSAISVTAMATEYDARDAAKKEINLKDGSIAYVFNGGKMGLENKYGIAVRTEPGTVLTTADGHKIKMVGDEVARLDMLLNQGLRS